MDIVLFSWLPFIVFIFHCFEEYPFFPQWATKHFGITSKPWYVYTHVVLFIMIVSICHNAANAEPQTWHQVALLSLIWSLACNTVFHIISSIAFKEYSPGLVTGAFLFIPAIVYMSYFSLTQDILNLEQFLVAMIIGFSSMTLVIASLWLPMDMDWRFKLRKH